MNVPSSQEWFFKGVNIEPNATQEISSAPKPRNTSLVDCSTARLILDLVMLVLKIESSTKCDFKSPNSRTKTCNDA
uniref:Ovule protein n=1 Tax=Heterorhabditis bacteriophora TaxID=37862 RepID=A0A1I7XID4_HETBA